MRLCSVAREARRTKYRRSG